MDPELALWLVALVLSFVAVAIAVRLVWMAWYP